MRRTFRTVRLKHLSQSGVFASGNARFYYRPKGAKGVALPDLPCDAPGFLAAYAKAAGLSAPPLSAPRTGTIGAGILAFLASDEYLSRASTTRGQWRRQLDRIRTDYGSGVLKDLRGEHITKDLTKLRPHPANTRLKVWRAVCAWWKEAGLRTDNPAEGVKRRKVPKSHGHQYWTEEEVAAFRAWWRLDSAERLAFELLHWTGARMSDAVRLTEGMIGRDGWLTFTQGKTDHAVHIPLRCTAPEYADPTGQAFLLAALKARPARHAVLMVTQHGKPRSIKAASAWFAGAARAAGIRGKSAHGLRKRRGNILAENGANTKQMAAWLGH